MEQGGLVVRAGIWRSCAEKIKSHQQLRTETKYPCLLQKLQKHVHFIKLLFWRPPLRSHARIQEAAAVLWEFYRNKEKDAAGPTVGRTRWAPKGKLGLTPVPVPRSGVFLRYYGWLMKYSCWAGLLSFQHHLLTPANWWVLGVLPTPGAPWDPPRPTTRAGSKQPQKAENFPSLSY